MELFIQSIINSFIQAAFFSLWAVGLVLIFGVMRVINFAHGELVMSGAYTVWVLYGKNGISFFWALFFAVSVASLIGITMEYFLFRKKRDEPLGGLICSLGVLFILEVAAHLIGGSGPSKQVIPYFQGSLSFFNDIIRIPSQRLFSFIMVIFAFFGLLFFLTQTRLGWSIRAIAADREAAMLQGINVNKTALIAMGISAGLAGLAGGLMAPLTNINPYMGHNIMITAIIVTIVGGLGSLTGTVITAILYAFFHTFTTSYFDGTIATIGGLCIMILVLIIKPTGFMGQTT